MNNLQIFESEEFGEVRTVTIDDEPWFVGKDVAAALGYSNTKDALISHVLDEDKRILQRSEIATIENHFPKEALPVNFVTGDIPNRGLTIINESGLYALIFGSKLESAKRFKRWVTSEVLPSIRKTGSYQRLMSPEEMMRVQLGMIDNIGDRVSKLENTMNIDYGQQRVLEREVAKVVIDALGGKDSNAYHEIGKKVFAECNHDVKDFFNVNSRNNIPRLKFDKAVEYIRNWGPCTNTRMLIKECNSQLNM